MTIKVDKYTFISIIVDIVLLMSGILLEVPILFIATLIVFVSMMFFCYRDFENRVLLFAFGISFFVFLIGREFLELYFHYLPEHYSDTINTHTYLCLLVSLLVIWVSYAYFENKKKRKIVSVGSFEESQKTRNIRNISKAIFYVSIPVAIGVRLLVARYVMGSSYFEYYTDFSEMFYGNTLLYYISRLENFVPVSLGIMCATLPSKKEVKAPLILYFIYLIVSLGGGNRGTCLLGFMYIFIFLVYMQGVRPEEKWFNRKYLILLVLAFPAMAMISSVMSMARTGDTSPLSMFQSFVDFFYDQGVSITVVKHAYEYADQIPKQGPYLLEFLHSGIPARLLGITVYHGNTADHAMYGGSFTHALAYTFMRGSYLAGRGTGSSYIAELFFDANYIGLIIGNIIYGWIFVRIIDFNQNNLFRRALIFTLLTQFLWAPRGSYTGFLGFLFAPTTIVAFVVVWGLTNLIRNKNKPSEIMQKAKR